MEPFTYLKPNGEWGIEGVDLSALPSKVYGALCKLRDLEHPHIKTNGDFLRSLSDEEFAEVFSESGLGDTCPPPRFTGGVPRCSKSCVACWLEVLKGRCEDVD